MCAEDREAHQETPSGPGASIPLSPEDLHRALLRAHGWGNQLRRKFLRMLLHLHESRYYSLLGFSSTCHYAERYFRYQPTQVLEFLRVARALRELPRIDAAFDKGELSWSVVQEITRVAAAETESKWIEFSSRHSFKRIRAEARDAKEKGRKAPRSDRYGLPNVKIKWSFELKAEEHALVLKALERAVQELKEKGGEPGEMKDALLQLSKRYLELRAAGDSSAGKKPGSSIYTILYHRCPECLRASLPTPEGPIEIPARVIERVEGEARKFYLAPEEELPPALSELGLSEESDLEPVPIEERDRPNDHDLILKVRLRDGMVCANPFCRAKGHLHAHHLKHRVRGGRTMLWNEILLCGRCHSAAHGGRLAITGDPLRGYRFEAIGDAVEPAPQERCPHLDNLPGIDSGENAAGSGIPGSVITDPIEDPARPPAVIELG